MKLHYLKSIKIILASMVLSIPFASFAEKVCIRIGHPTGTYSYVHDDEEGQTLICKGDGREDCVWDDGTKGLNFVLYNNVITEDQAAQYVQAQVANNILSGSVSGDDGISYFSWSVDLESTLTFTFSGNSN